MSKLRKKITNKLKKLQKKILPKSYFDRRAILDGSDERFASSGQIDIREDITEKYGFSGELLDIFSRNTGNVVHKWHHYIPIYDRYFKQFRGKKIRFLEIGVSRGGSLKMWREYFGTDAIIYGVDINPECEKYNGLSGEVRIGSQVDASFLTSVVDEMGGVDVILDDGSHEMEHLPVTLEILYPRLSMGGIYMIEDLHTAYWTRYGGGPSSPSNFFNYIRTLTDDLHADYLEKPKRNPAISDFCSGIHIHDSIVVLDKNRAYRPVHSTVGVD